MLQFTFHGTNLAFEWSKVMVLSIKKIRKHFSSRREKEPALKLAEDENCTKIIIEMMKAKDEKQSSKRK
jgi:hypothetical protein